MQYRIKIDFKKSQILKYVMLKYLLDAAALPFRRKKQQQ
jgi:hypothetical protein